MSLPTQKTKPKSRLSDYTLLIYGAPKTGKTTFVSNFKSVIFAATEAGHNALSVFISPINKWNDFLQFCGEIAKDGHNFENVCIDTIENLYRLCTLHICEKHNVEHEGDLKYGKGHALVLNEFLRALTKLSQLPIGLILISHATTEEIETRTGSYQKAVANLRARIRQPLLGMCDFILFFTMRTTGGETNVLERAIYTKPSKYYDAGDRTGRLPKKLPLDYNDFMSAFNIAIKNIDKPLPKEIPPSKPAKTKPDDVKQNDAKPDKKPDIKPNDSTGAEHPKNKNS